MTDTLIEADNDILIVQVEPEECGALWRKLEDRLTDIRGVVLDFSQVGYLNSMNIAAIISLRSKLEREQRHLELAGLSTGLASVFRVLKLERLFNLEQNREQAVSAARG